MNYSRRKFLKTTSTGLLGLGGVAALSGSAAAGRYTIYSDLRTYEDGVTADEIDNAILEVRGDCPLVGLGSTWKDVAAEQGMNAVYMAAHAAHESAWGTSNIAQDKNNIYGWGAYDSDPYDGAKRFDSFEHCIRHVMPRVRDLYLTPGAQYYEGAHLAGMNVHYATDDQWAEKIRDVMNLLASNIDYGGGSGTSYSWPTYSYGDQAESVYSIQYLLEEHGYSLQYHDGIYGSEVQSTVESFQSARGLAVDGVVGPNTWEELYVTVWDAENDPWWATYGAQHHLRYGQGYDIAVDGYYGPETRGAIEDFQSNAGITVDGIVGHDTWQALADR
ncbi:peptidoglycan-binding protein [Halorussus caseinilyticus]|uniref:Peptidoglycan-binding protein n=1 Tax=Halorussus caseinilyticus TaxID=3034025 RepID=A0ABD5WL24_9EURY|nr:peptidoglycan-binding protein [Halorussus sp. DT72]